MLLWQRKYDTAFLTIRMRSLCPWLGRGSLPDLVATRDAEPQTDEAGDAIWTLINGLNNRCAPFT